MKRCEWNFSQIPENAMVNDACERYENVLIDLPEYFEFIESTWGVEQKSYRYSISTERDFMIFLQSRTFQSQMENTWCFITQTHIQKVFCFHSRINGKYTRHNNDGIKLITIIIFELSTTIKFSVVYYWFCFDVNMYFWLFVWRISSDLVSREIVSLEHRLPLRKVMFEKKKIYFNTKLSEFTWIEYYIRGRFSMENQSEIHWLCGNVVFFFFLSFVEIITKT